MLENMKRIKVTMLGISGSGKTSFISGLYHSLVSGTVKKNGSLTSLIGLEDDGTVHATTGLSTSQLLENYKIKEVMSAFSGTFETQDFNFNLRLIDKGMREQFVPIHVFDYKGGLLMDLEDESEILLNQVKNSDAILIMLDAIMLTHYADDMFKCKEITGADHMNMIMNSLSTVMNKKGVTILTVLTKTDSNAIPDVYKADDFLKLKELAKEALDTVFAFSEFQSSTKNWKYGIIPVTALGEGNSNTEEIPGGFKCEIKEGANVKQKNIDTALLYAIYNSVESRIKEYEDDVKNLEEVIAASKKFGFDRKARKKEAEVAKIEMDAKQEWINVLNGAKNTMAENFVDDFVAEIK